MSLLTEEESINTSTAEVQTPSDQPSWWIDENVAGPGERPNFLPEKFKSVSDFAKSYAELEKKLSTQITAPKEYDFSKGEAWIEPDYEPFQEMANLAKTHNVPQQVMDSFLESVGYYLDEFKTDISEEKSKLGEKASERLKLLNNWAKNNLSEKSFSALTAGMRTAEQIEALEELRAITLNQTSMVPTGSETSNTTDNLEKYRAELYENYGKYKSDSAYRKQMEHRLGKIIGE